jgi:FkbM family methyltransferase
MEISLKQQALRFIGHQQWLRGRDRILRTFVHPDHQQSFAFETDFFGRTYSGNMTNFIDWTVFYYGAFNIQELRLLAELAGAFRAQGKPVNFFDVGANIGHHALYMSSYADRVFAFEPFSVVRNEMERKLAYAAVDNVIIFPVALGDKNENASFHPPTGANQGTGTLGDTLPDNASAETISVQVVRGDDFFTANHLPPITLLKLDVEGFEAQALEGLRKTIWRDRPPIFMELQHVGSGPQKGVSVRELLYPDHLVFAVGHTRGQFTLTPFQPGSTEEALVLPAELAGIIRDTNAR